jgi:hypothetical protein
MAITTMRWTVTELVDPRADTFRTGQRTILTGDNNVGCARGRLVIDRLAKYSSPATTPGGA